MPPLRYGPRRGTLLADGKLMRPPPLRLAGSGGAPTGSLAWPCAKTALRSLGAAAAMRSATQRVTCGAATLVPFIETQALPRVPAARTPRQTSESSLGAIASGPARVDGAIAGPSAEYLAA